MSHEKSFDAEYDGKHVLLPSVFPGSDELPNDAARRERAMELYEAGQLQPLGVFGSAPAATAAARERSERYAFSALRQTLGTLSPREQEMYGRLIIQGRSRSDALDLVYQARKALRDQ